MDNYNANVKVRGLPRKTDQVLEALASLRGLYKWQIIKEALVEYANNHEKDVLRLINR